MAGRLQAGRAALLVLVVLGCAQEPPSAADPAPTAPEVTAPTPAVPVSPETVTPAPDEECPEVCYDEPVRVGEFDAVAIPGASGLAAGRRNPDVLYVLDDRPGTSEVWAVRTDGEMVGAIGVAGLDALDTESLAVSACGPGDDRSCVYVGDIGDNLRARPDVTVHRFPEPDLASGVPSAPVDAAVIRLSYPDQPSDAEALLVDGDGVPHIVTKARFDPETGETGETRLYRAPGFGDGVLEDLGVVPVPEPPEPLHSQFVGNVVTGGDQLPGRVVLRTYDQVLEFAAADEVGPLAAFPTWTVRSVPSPFEPQSEAIAWASDGCGYYTVSEQVGDIWHVPCRP